MLRDVVNEALVAPKRGEPFVRLPGSLAAVALGKGFRSMALRPDLSSRFALFRLLEGKYCKGNSPVICLSPLPGENLSLCSPEMIFARPGEVY